MILSEISVEFVFLSAFFGAVDLESPRKSKIIVLNFPYLVTRYNLSRQLPGAG